MKKSKFKIGTLALCATMAFSMLFPMYVNAQGGGADGFFKGGSDDYGSRDEAGVSGGITNDSFDAPLGSGLMIMLAAGVGYAVRKRRGLQSHVAVTLIMATALSLGMTQCKKNGSEVIPYNNKVDITLNLDGGDKTDVNPLTGKVDFVDGDELIVANHGAYVGKLVFDDGVFSGTIMNPHNDDYLHFFHLGNKDCGTLTAGISASCSVSISDQINAIPVISAGCSNELFSSENTMYTAKLYNKCALVKFDIETGSEYASTYISGFKNQVTVDFSDDTFSFSMVDDGKISLPSGSGCKWAILLPQDELAAGADGTAVSGRFKGSRGVVPQITANEVYDEGVTVTVDEPMIPQGALNALFSVNEQGKKVHFSKANLSYTIATKEWNFLEHQYDNYEGDQYKAGTDYYVRSMVTLFGWGASGFEHGSVCYYPNVTSSSVVGYYAYGDPTKNLYDMDGRADWGYNKIVNGGGMYKQWRSLTREEWWYLLVSREHASDKFAEAKINASTTKKGFVILPDDWSDPYEGCFNPGIGNAYETNVYSLEQWEQMEAAGAVFLPAAGRRMDETCFGAQKYMFLWTSTMYDDRSAYVVFIKPTDFRPNRVDEKGYGAAVRLVCE